MAGLIADKLMKISGYGTDETWCKNCGDLKSRHATGGKCLFQPTMFEAVSEEEYVKKAMTLSRQIFGIRK